MEVKSFFQRRTPSEISSLEKKLVEYGEDSIYRIDELSLNESLCLTTPILPQLKSTQANSSRFLFKHKHTPVVLPRTIKAMKLKPSLNYQITSDLEKKLQSSSSGYSYRSIHGQHKRVVPFVNLLEGSRIFSYSHNYAPIEIHSFHLQSFASLNEGANALVSVPSRRKKQQRYSIVYSHIPLRNSRFATSVGTDLTTHYFSHPHKATLTRFTRSQHHESSFQFVWYPQEIAGYFHLLGEKKSEISIVDSPFIFPSQNAVDFYKKLLNNVIVQDPTLKTSSHRTLHLAEISSLLGSAYKEFGGDWFCAKKHKDGNLRDYDWRVV